MIEVKTIEIKKLAERIKGLNITDVRLGKALGNLLVKSTRERILRKKVSPHRKAWVPRSQATLDILEKAKARGGIADIGTLLHLTGNLAKIHYSTSRFQFNGELSVFSNAEYSEFIQEGTKKMPARPFLGLSVKDYLLIRKTFINHAKKQIEEGLW